MSRDKILIIDDESAIRSSLKGILEDEGFQALAVETGEDGLRQLDQQNFDLVLLDIWLPGMSGLEALRHIKTLEDHPQVVMISGHGTVETAVQAVKLGAFDFLEKPLTLEKVLLTVKNALKQFRLEEENIQLREKFKLKYHLAGTSPAVQRLREDMEKAAPTSGRILISGENGTGKELIARLIHQHSRRRDKRFVEINCAAVPADLLEVDLFGTAKASPPQAGRERKGKLLLADGGTLFLDEVGDMNTTVQAKLVRVIEDQAFVPAGAADPRAVDVRFIAATTKSLKELIAQDKFREDLYFKLNVIPLTIPPLRERPQDIPALITHFLSAFADEYGRKLKTMSPEALQAFLNYSWPGNVSELMNVVERFVIMVEEPEIKESHLSLLVETREIEQSPELSHWPPLHQAKELFEKRYLHQALIRNQWDVGRTAARLGLDPQALKERMAALKIALIN